ncbi:uncharacterized protein LOC144710108 isoform X1 [Wolffia australiana]
MAIGIRCGQRPGRGGSVGSRILVTINVLGSAGPIRFLVGDGELVASVISKALRAYAREGRFPVLGSDPNEFLLFCAHSAYMDALVPGEPIGAKGGREFVLCKKELCQTPSLATVSPTTASPAGTMTGNSQRKKAGNGSGGSWKAWLNKSFSFKISSH